MKKIILPFLLVFLFLSLQAQQLITVSPEFATVNDNNVIVTFDASQGNAGLIGTSSIYAHTGVITSLSTSNTDWKYVIATWTTNLPKALLTRIGSSNSYTLNIGNIRTFYGVPANETILKLAFVFRNADGSKTGKTTANGDIFVDINQGSFEVKINNPLPGSFFNLSDSVSMNATASSACNLKLFANGVQVANANNALSLSYKNTLASLGSGRVNLILEGDNNGVKSYDTTYIMQRVQSTVAAAPAGIVDGINYINDSTVTLQLFAPLKQFVYVIGDFTNWEFQPAMLMNKTPDNSRYWITIKGLIKGKEYGFQYVIDNIQMRVADIYADKVLDPYNDQWIAKETYPNLMLYPVGKTTEVVSVLRTGEAPYIWKTTTFQKPVNDKLFIYELLLRDFIGKHDFKTLRDTIGYLKRVGINCVKLMPIMEFEGNESWGYNPMFYFALDKYYGTKNDMKAFVDECHANGIAVVLDIALNHSFGQNPQVRMYFNPAAGQYGQPTPENPWFNQVDKHPFGVGYDYNHEATAVQNFTDRVIKYWITEYKVDGYRFDLSKGFTQKNTLGDVGGWSAYDQSRINIWSRIKSEITKYAPDAYLILEHLGDNSEEKVLADMGFMLWGKMTENYAEANMGYNNGKANLSWGNYKSRGFVYPNLITYAESHDEERIMFSTLSYGNAAGSYSTKNLNNALKRVAAYHALLLLLKGPKMIWQGGELGYEISINTNGRTGNKPFLWQYLNDANRAEVLNQVGKLAKLKNHVSFGSDNYVYDVAGTGKILRVTHDSLNTVVVGNFDVVSLNISPGFQNTGWWYNYITGDSLNVTATNQSLSLNPGDYVVYTNKNLNKKSANPSIGIPELNQINISVFPNPSTAEFYIDADNNNINGYDVFDIFGRLVLSKNTDGANANEMIDLRDCSSGVYWLKVYAGEKASTLKLVLEK
jgi:1,4-alpha-glucan branching enzyme